MKCKKCGTEAGNAILCPNCGTHMIVSHTVGDILKEQDAKHQAGTIQPPKKSKKPWILAAVFVIACAALALYLAYPYLKRTVMPDNHAATVLKAETNRLQDKYHNQLTDYINGKAQSHDQTGVVRMNEMTEDSTHYMDYLNVNTLQYDIHQDGVNGSVRGIFGLAKNDENPVVQVYFYENGNDVYFKIPQLFTGSYKMTMQQLENRLEQSADEVDIDRTYIEDAGTVWNLFANYTNEDDRKEYATVITKVLPVITENLNKMWDKAAYEKREVVSVETEKGVLDAQQYQVTVSKEQFMEMAEQSIYQIYADTSLTAYTSLLASVKNITKESLLQTIREALSDMEQITFSIAVNDQDRIVGVSLQNNTQEATAEMTYTFAGADEPLDICVLQLLTEEHVQNSSKLQMMIRRECRAKEAKNLSMADFKEALDVTQMSSTQKLQLVQQMIDNIGIINQIFTEKGTAEIGMLQ